MGLYLVCIQFTLNRTNLPMVKDTKYGKKLLRLWFYHNLAILTHKLWLAYVNETGNRNWVFIARILIHLQPTEQIQIFVE